MELMVLILNQVDCLEDILNGFLSEGLSGATVIDSTGMLTVLSASDVEAPPIFGSLRQFLNPEHECSKTVLAVLRPGQLQIASRIINQAVGGLGNPNTGILFTVPVNYVEGIRA